MEVSDPDDGSGDWYFLDSTKDYGAQEIGPLTRMMTFKRIGSQKNL